MLVIISSSVELNALTAVSQLVVETLYVSISEDEFSTRQTVPQTDEIKQTESSSAPPVVTS